MVVVSYSGKEINAKLVYYGAGLSGKTTNLESIYEAVPETSRGKMVSMKTQSDRTLFFDLLPLDLGEIMGFKTRFLLYTVPGQVFYNATRKLVLKGADAVVFVADSAVGKMDENKESLANLRANLTEYGLKLDEIPWVIQYNKRDLPSVYSVEELNAALIPDGKVPSFEAVATQGTGVFETFRGISHLLMQKVTRELHRGSPGGRARAEEEQRAVEARRPPGATPSVMMPMPADFGRPPGGAAASQPALAGPHGSEDAGGQTTTPPGSGRAREDVGRELEITKAPSVGGSRDRETIPQSFPGEELVFESDGSARRSRGTPATATPPVADRPTGSHRFEEHTLSLEGRDAALAPSRREEAREIPSAPVRREAAREAPSETGSREIEVPVVLPAGSAAEIVLRITVRTTPER